MNAIVFTSVLLRVTAGRGSAAQFPSLKALASYKTLSPMITFTVWPDDEVTSVSVKT